ncbi:fucose mutarotase-like [Lineus longissimus]|uniref:fucose mutarotase-like n=1 Tax=Lineus longissimus TaxID=88925 RepID=UPI002B4DDDCF
MPLRGIPNILSPDLLHVLAAMGHGDEIVLADAHFPSSSLCRSGTGRGAREVRADGHNIPDLLGAILKLMPLDQYVDNPVILMDLVRSDKESGLKVPIWDKYTELVNAAEKKEIKISKVDRFDFYDRAKTAYAIVHTGESSVYGNVILKKGVLV